MSSFITSVSKVIRLMAEEYGALTDPIDRRHVRIQISKSIRNATDHPSFKIYISAGAKMLAEQKGIDLASMTWANQVQSRFDPGRQNFAYEHMVPVKNLVYAVLDEPCRAEEILRKAVIVWVTRDENERLNRLGYAHKRTDPLKCYEEAGIEVLL